MKEAKKAIRQNIRYLGFETRPDGGRRFDFAITAPGQSATRVTLVIGAEAFTGENRISYQESSKICYEKLRVLLEDREEINEPLHITLTHQDIARHRHVPRGKARPRE